MICWECKWKKIINMRMRISEWKKSSVGWKILARWNFFFSFAFLKQYLQCTSYWWWWSFIRMNGWEFFVKIGNFHFFFVLFTDHGGRGETLEKNIHYSNRKTTLTLPICFDIIICNNLIYIRLHTHTYTNTNMKTQMSMFERHP